MEGRDIKEGLTLFSDALKIYVIMFIVIISVEILFMVLFGGLMISMLANQAN
jgi:hypothetical protein